MNVALKKNCIKVRWITWSWIAKHGISKSRSFWSRFNFLNNWAQVYRVLWKSAYCGWTSVQRHCVPSWIPEPSINIILLRICQHILIQDLVQHTASRLSPKDSAKTRLRSHADTMWRLVQSKAVIKDSSYRSVPTAARVKSAWLAAVFPSLMECLFFLQPRMKRIDD